MDGVSWSWAALHDSVQAVWPGIEVEPVDSLDSTNSELMRRAHGGVVRPKLLVARNQTAGRGRMGRQWTSAPTDQEGDSLTFSFGLPLAKRDWSGLSVAVGVALAAGLDAAFGEHPAGERIGLKWPNDLWWQGRKLAGILIETVTGATGMYAVIGVGINIACPPESDLATAPAGLKEIWPDCTAPQALHAVASPLLLAVQGFGGGGLAAFQVAFAKRDVLAGRRVAALHGHAGGRATLVGTARGIDITGALLLHTDAGMHRISSSEVSLRPLDGALGKLQS